MGLVYATLEVVGPTQRPEPIDFLIDSGAVYSALPRAVWKRLGLRPTFARTIRPWRNMPLKTCA